MPKLPMGRPCALLLAVGLTACATAPEALRLPGGARRALDARTAPGTLDASIRALEWTPSSFVLPAPPDRERADQVGYWLARAVAHAPDVRAARTAWRAARAARVGAGAPAPVFGQAVDHEFGGEDQLFEAVFVFDVLGLLGVGPASAEREVARAAEGLALARLESSAWSAWVAAERARIGVAVARRRAAALAALGGEALSDLERVAILERTGRVGAAPAAAARGANAAVVRQVSRAGDAASAAWADLVERVGAKVTAEDAEALGVAPLDLVGAENAPVPDDHPDLRAARHLFGLREAEVREAASRAWPTLGLGPHLGFMDGTRLGGALRFTVPFPSSWRGRLGAAVEQRDGAVLAYEDTLLALEARASDARVRRASALERLGAETAALDAATSAAWAAMRASFRTGRADVAEWTDALQRRAGAIAAVWSDEEAVALATLDLVAARGPRATRFDGARVDVHAEAEVQR